MTAEDFVSKLQKTIIEDNIEIYKDLFKNINTNKEVTQHWKESSDLFSLLTEDQRKLFFNIIGQVIVDTTSNLLGIIDGSSTLHNFDGEIELRVDNEIVSGDLQGIFLAAEEEKPNSDLDLH